MNLYIIIGFLVALIVVGTGAFFKGESVGKAAEEAVWQTREAKINAETALKIEEANKKVRDAEHAKADELNAVDTAYQRRLKGKEDALQTALNTIRTGTSGLSGHGAACPPVSGNAQGSTAASPGVGDGSAGAKLLNEADWVFLISEASRADKIVEQLTACQAVVAADRKP